MTDTALAITDIYAAEHGRLERIVRRLVGNDATSKDLVQQAFLNVLTKETRPDNWSAYLSRTVRNLALNHLRDTLRKSEVVLTDDDFQAIADQAPTPEIVAIYRSELLRLLQAIAALPVRRREAFVLNKFEGLSYDEIAARQKISRNTVISQIVSALLDLRRELERD